MDAIDLLILRSQKISISFYRNSEVNRIKIVFPINPTEETLKPLSRILALPGFEPFATIEECRSSGVYRICCPETYDAKEVAEALAETWNETWKNEGAIATVTESSYTTIFR